MENKVETLLLGYLYAGGTQWPTVILCRYLTAHSATRGLKGPGPSCGPVQGPITDPVIPRQHGIWLVWQELVQGSAPTAGLSPHPLLPPAPTSPRMTKHDDSWPATATPSSWSLLMHSGSGTEVGQQQVKERGQVPKAHFITGCSLTSLSFRRQPP